MKINNQINSTSIKRPPTKSRTWRKDTNKQERRRTARPDTLPAAPPDRAVASTSPAVPAAVGRASRRSGAGAPPRPRPRPAHARRSAESGTPAAGSAARRPRPDGRHSAAETAAATSAPRFPEGFSSSLLPPRRPRRPERERAVLGRPHPALSAQTADHVCGERRPSGDCSRRRAGRDSLPGNA